MNKGTARMPAHPFFLDANPGRRFCMFHPPGGDKGCRGIILHVHPFGEEMNKARRVSALQARAFANAGYGVLQIDLYGCGDSDGECRDARWEVWKEDVALAMKWIKSRHSAPISLWGVRLGALLALDCARENHVPDLIFWQPVLEGKTYLTQYLRLISGGSSSPGTQSLRSALAAGETLEAGGYELTPTLASAIDGLEGVSLIPPYCTIHWFEIVSEENKPIAPARAAAAKEWARKCRELRLHAVQSPPFWATHEITECPGLLAAMARHFPVAAHAV